MEIGITLGSTGFHEVEAREPKHQIATVCPISGKAQSLRAASPGAAGGTPNAIPFLSFHRA